MNETYIEYWGLKKHPFLLAPDSSMMNVTGQYYECLERLKYAINTNKGGVLVISEDAGLGKTTILLRLIEEMKEEYRDAFRYAFVDHPSLTSEQMIAQITGHISGLAPFEDKLKNLTLLKNALIEVKEQGGKSIIVVDEGQMLCDTKDMLQELRILINLTHNNEYLHTFILAGQKALWQTVKDMPEFWQRLPVRYYFVPLKFEEASELIKHRLYKAGADGNRDVFTNDALDIIHKYSKGSPRTLIALSDLSLLIGCSDRAAKIGFKEVSKAINAMSGKGETLQYIREGAGTRRGRVPGVFVEARASDNAQKSQAGHYRGEPGSEAQGRKTDHFRVLLISVIVTLSIVLGAMAGYLLTGSEKKEIPAPTPLQKEVEKPFQQPTSQTEAFPPQQVLQLPSLPPQQDMTVVRVPIPEVKIGPQETQASIPVKPERVVEVTKDGANVRIDPDMGAVRIAVIFKGETIKVKGEKVDKTGSRWYKVALYGNRDGWISGSVVKLK